MPTVGRGQWLLVAGLALEAAVLSGRALLALSSTAVASGILQASALQTLTFLATFSVVLISSMGFVFMARDRADENNRIMAAIDPLTGVANRRSLISALDRDVSRAVRTREPIALMMVDIDHFKRVNDRYGHPAGDQVLCSVVDVLRGRVRAQDLVGRYGGEEFMVVLPDTTLLGAEQLARELCRAVAESRCRIGSTEGGSDTRPEPGGTSIAVTVSIGVFGGRLESGDSWDMLIAAADRALYQAKENGRNRVEVATACGARLHSAPPWTTPRPIPSPGTEQPRTPVGSPPTQGPCCGATESFAGVWPCRWHVRRACVGMLVLVHKNLLAVPAQPARDSTQAPIPPSRRAVHERPSPRPRPATRPALERVSQAWDNDIVRQLTDYIAIPAKSPMFSPDWAAQGLLDTVVRNAAAWVESQKVEGLTLEVVRLEGRTPVLFFEIDATQAGAHRHRAHVRPPRQAARVQRLAQRPWPLDAQVRRRQALWPGRRR